MCVCLWIITTDVVIYGWPGIFPLIKEIWINYKLFGFKPKLKWNLNLGLNGSFGMFWRKIGLNGLLGIFLRKIFFNGILK